MKDLTSKRFLKGDSNGVICKKLCGMFGGGLEGQQRIQAGEIDDEAIPTIVQKQLCDHYAP